MAEQRILLVEDNADDEDLALLALGQYDFPAFVDVARDGAEALDYLLDTPSHAVPPTLILLDLKLPKVSGMEVLKRVRSEERTRRIPVIVLTSSSEHADVAKCYDLGANSYIRKPVDFDQFTKVVHQLGLYWLRLNEGPPAG